MSPRRRSEFAWMNNPDPQEALKQLQQGQNRFSPINEEIVRMRLNFIKLHGTANKVPQPT